MDNTLRSVKHRGRIEQIPIYLGKLIRMFIFQNDWIAIPMSAVIAGMVAMVIRGTFGVNMEGTLKGAFALSCVAIWNGCFNSIQAVCRERNVVKREHRSGMHITSYLSAHIIYQAAICLIQTGLTVGMLGIAKVKLSGPGIITSWLVVDLTMSIFIIMFTSDMLALMISCFVRNTTVAMTVMPFLLIFQLVFSGGIFSNLPKWADSISNLTISKFGLNCIAAQMNYNDLPMATGWKLIGDLKGEVILDPKTLGELLEAKGMVPEEYSFTETQLALSLVDKVTIDDIIQIVGEEKVKDAVNAKLTNTGYRESFESTAENVADSWATIILSGMIYMLIAIISLEFIDKDKR